MNYNNTDDNSITEIKSREIPVDYDDLYDPSDNLAGLHWLASFIDEPSLGNVSACFGAETKDLHGVEQISDEFRNSSSISALESSSCSGNIPTCFLDVTAPRKKRSIRARVPFSNWSTRSLPLCISNPAMENRPNTSVSANADVSEYSDFLSSEQTKSQSSNRLSKTDRGIETKKVIKCMHCGTQKTPQWRAGPMDSKTLCNACGLRYRHGKLVPEYRPRPSASPAFSVDEIQVRKCMHCGTQKTLQWRSGPMGPSTLCNACGERYRHGKLLSEYRPKLVKCMHCGTQKSPKTRCNGCGLRYMYGRFVPEDRPSSSSRFSVDKHSEAKGQKDFTSQASEAKQTSSGSEVLENCPNSSLLANTADCSGSDYSVSKQTKSDSKKGIIRKGQDAMNARKCVACGNQRNPQCRAETLDSVTPCNTCGVKYRSGRNLPDYSPVASPKFSADKLVLERKAQKELAYQGKQTHIASQLQETCAEPPQNGKLLPEYRPAASPTFSANKHLNSHKKSWK